MHTPYHTLKKFKDTNGLSTDDWRLVQIIFERDRTALRVCCCTDSLELSGFKFTGDAQKSYTSPHPAAGLGPIKVRFRCNGCEKNVSALNLLLAHYESNTTPSVNFNASRSGPSTDSCAAPLTTITDHSSLGTSTESCAVPVSTTTFDITPTPPEVADTHPTSTSTSDPIRYVEDRSPPPHPKRLCEDFNTNFGSSQELFTQSISNLPPSTTIHLGNQRLGKVFCRGNNRLPPSTTTPLASQEAINQAILSTLGDLVKQIQQLNSRIAVLEQHSSSPSTDGSTGNTVPPTSQRSTSGTALTSSQSSSSNVPAQNTTWARVASASTTVALQKARDNSQLPARIDGFNALRDLSKKTTRPTRALNTSTTAIYVSGFEFEKYGKIWKALRTARFQTSRIPSIQWIGKTVLEFIVFDTYATQFSSEIQVAGFKVLRDFNPARCNNTLSPEDAATIRRAFTIRCVKNIVFPSNPFACSHFEKVFAKARSEDPALGPLYDSEMQAATQEKASRIDALVFQASASPSPSEEELKLIIKSLDALSPSHELVVAARKTKTTSAPPANTTTTDTDTGIIADVDMIVEENHLLIGNTAAASTLEDGSGEN
jgi:hypothetical protein